LARPTNWLSSLKDRILRNYTGKISPKLPSKPVVTYLSRQTAAHRHLTDEAHAGLIAGLKALEDEGVAEVNIEEFTDADPKDEQIAKLSRTTVSYTCRCYVMVADCLFPGRSLSVCTATV
jgi:hypothetical protein